MKIRTALEGLLFIAGDEGIQIEELGEIFPNSEELQSAIVQLENDYNKNDDSALQIKKFGTSYKFTTKSKHHDFYRNFFSTITVQQLSNAALEVLAIVAYNQPLTRARIEDVRGVNSDGVIKRLELLELIEEVGREESIGNPILFGVTNQFLDYFGLLTIEELPQLKDASLEDIQEEVDIFMTKYQELETDIEEE